MGSTREMQRLLVGALALLLVAVALVNTPLSAQAAVATPSSLSPNGGTQSDVPTLTWSRVSGAARYDVQISTSSSFATTLVSAATYNRRYVPAVQLPATVVYWRVRSVSSTGSTSAWAATSFSRTMLAGPTLQSPADAAVLPQPSDPPVLAWSSVPNASSYEVMIDNDPDFIDATTATTATTSHVVVSPQPATTFWWKVRAIRGTGLNTHWSTVRSYTIGGLNEVTPSLPVEQTQVEDIVFDWPAVPGAKDYELRVSTDEDFNTLLAGTPVVVKSTRYSPPATYNNDEYWWQVRARDNAGNSIPWTDEARVPVRQFQRHWPDVPALQFPADSVSTPVGDPFFFQWSPVEHASRYQIDMGTQLNFSPGSFTTCYTRATTLTPGSSGANSQTASCTPQPGQVYYWRVRALDEPTNVNGIWSGIRAFVYNPGLVTPAAPANGSTVAIPTVRWEAARDADRYRVVIRNNAGSVVAQTETHSLSWTPMTKLNATQSPFRWSVTSIDNNGHESPALMTGDQWTFSLAGAPTTTGVAPLTPLSGHTTTFRFPELRWEPDPEAAYYKLYLDASGSGFLKSHGGNLAYPTVTDTAKTWLASGTYDWIVEAYGAGNLYLGRSDTRGKFTIQDLSAVSGQKVALSGTSLDDNACDNRLDTATGANFCDDLRQTPVLDWDPTPGAGHYLVYLYRDREMTNPVYPAPHYITTQNTRWTPTELLPDSQAGDAYFWFVRPCKASGICAPDPTEATHAFDKRSQGIDLVAPADGATIADELELSWQDNLENVSEAAHAQHLEIEGAATNATVEAKQYRVQVSDDPTFATVLKTEVVDQTSYTPFSQTFSEGPLYWRVQAIDGSGNSLTWSESRRINKQSAPVVQTAPVPGGSTSGTPFFRWAPQDFAAGYILEVYDDNDTTLSTSNRVLHVAAKQPAYAPTQPLATSGLSYLWRVRRLDADNRPGQWSPIRSFKVTGEAPEQSSPNSSSYVRGNDSVFAWTSVAGAATYMFERRLDGATNNTETVTTYAQAWAPTTHLTDGVWEWRVSSLDSSRRIIASSPWRPFKVDSVAPSVTRKSPGGTTTRRDSNWVVTFSEPVRRVNNTTMRLYRSGRASPVAAKITSSNGGKTWTLNPSSLMAQRVRYTLRLSSGITDRGANPLAATSYSRTVR